MSRRLASRILCLSFTSVFACHSGSGPVAPVEGVGSTAVQAVLPEGAVRAGFEAFLRDGRVWVFTEGSEELASFQAGEEPEKHVTAIGALPGGITVKAPDTDTLNAYLAVRPGFETRVEDGRIWIFAADSEEAKAAREGELPEKHVTAIGAGPNGATLKAPSNEILEAYLASGG